MADKKRRPAVLCSSCRQLVNAEARKCPHCGAAMPGLFGFAPGLQRLFRDQLDLSQIIVGICILTYGASLVVDPGCVNRGIHLDFGAPSSEALYVMGMTGGTAWRLQHYWTLLSAIFLHGSLIHIAFNMMWTRSLAPRVIELYGPGRFFLMFVAAGVGGFVLSNLWSGAPTIGASGAIFGLMGVLIAYGKKRGGTFGEAIKSDMLMWAGLLFFMGFAMSGVNNAGHLGGLATGLVLGWVVPYKDRKPESRIAQLGALVVLLAVIASFAASILTMRPLVELGNCAF
ncbi:MAG: rhomboid family intramembrane serine protease [Alphaproteobacteria bacterium]|nr:rhomboid family intramembrane serine protease [Alphaproteobacteria bacterium]